MIFADMKGNIGNQMFIYACARKIQAETGDTILISTYYLKKNYPSYKFNLDIFRLNPNVIITDKKIPFFASTESKFLRAFRKLTFNKLWFQKLYFKFMSLFNVFAWNGVTYLKIKLRNRKNVYLSGYWQSPDYFEGIEDILKDEFTVKKELDSKNVDFLDQIKTLNSVCVSIRRGDYLSNPKVKKKHFVCDTPYFVNAVKTICNVVSNPTIICFSDDPQWVKENMSFGLPTIYESEGNTIEDKITLMRNCKHFVLSNSSFSWWVEYLSDWPNKKVVAPSTWYANGMQTDIFQKYWLLIDA